MVTPSLSLAIGDSIESIPLPTMTRESGQHLPIWQSTERASRISSGATQESTLAPQRSPGTAFPPRIRRNPRLTIGMPLFNNERTVLRALNSIAAQSFRDFIVIVSDDGSSDATVELAQSVVSRDPRFSLVRQPRNLNYGNFRVLINEAKTELFMFAAGDDFWHPNFVESCIQCLDENPQAVSAVSRVQFVNKVPLNYSTDTFALEDGAQKNIERFLRNSGDNSRMYGVFRTLPAQAAFPRNDHHAYDWTFSVGTLLAGTHLEIPQVLMYREPTPHERYAHYARRDAAGLLDRVLPLRAMTVALLREKHIPVSKGVLRALVWTNLRAHAEYVRVFHPRYARIASIILRPLLRII